jgi:hypothetical protein
MVSLIFQATAFHEFSLKKMHLIHFLPSFQAAYQHCNFELTFLTIVGKDSSPQGCYAMSNDEYLPMF